MLLDNPLQFATMDYAGMSPDSLSILEQYKGRYSLYAIFSSQVFMLVNVYLCNTCFISHNKF